MAPDPNPEPQDDAAGPDPFLFGGEADTASSLDPASTLKGGEAAPVQRPVNDGKLLRIAGFVSGAIGILLMLYSFMLA